jgi:pimeloyl-ACP methyl ester carboxylesterase
MSMSRTRTVGHTAWAFQEGAFAARYRVITFDNRGAGQTSAPDQPYTTAMMATDEAIRGPTLVSVAEDDILAPPRFSRAIAKRIPGAELRLVPGAGHCYFLERPEVFNAISLDFIARSSR